MGKEYNFKTRELGAMVVVVSALLIIVFFLGVTVGERHERAKRVKGEALQISIKRASKTGVSKGVPSKSSPQPSLKAQATQEKAVSPLRASTISLKKGFYVQVGAFREKKGALKWKEKLKGKGFDAIFLPPGPRGFYRVVVGPYGSKDLALRVAMKVDRIFKVRSSVVQDRNLP